MNPRHTRRTHIATSSGVYRYSNSDIWPGDRVVLTEGSNNYISVASTFPVPGHGIWSSHFGIYINPLRSSNAPQS